MSNSITCILTITAFYLLSLLQLFLSLLHLSLFHFCLLGGYCAQLFLISFIWGCTIASAQCPYYFLFLSFYLLFFPFEGFFPLYLYPSPYSMVCSQNVRMWTDTYFLLTKICCYLAGKFDNILFNWSIINFFLIEYYVRVYWIFYVLVCL